MGQPLLYHRDCMDVYAALESNDTKLHVFAIKQESTTHIIYDLEFTPTEIYDVCFESWFE